MTPLLASQRPRGSRKHDHQPHLRGPGAAAGADRAALARVAGRATADEAHGRHAAEGRPRRWSPR